LSALPNGRGGALAEEFGSVTCRFPWSVIAVEALSPMVFIHTRRIIIVPGHQYLLGFFPPLFESHRRLVSYICVAAGRAAGRRARDYTLFFFANGNPQHFDLGQEPLNLRSLYCWSGLVQAHGLSALAVSRFLGNRCGDAVGVVRVTALHNVVVIRDTLIRNDAQASRSHSTIVRCNLAGPSQDRVTILPPLF
jgi:hypothetical protein